MYVCGHYVQSCSYTCIPLTDTLNCSFVVRTLDRLSLHTYRHTIPFSHSLKERGSSFLSTTEWHWAKSSGWMHWHEFSSLCFLFLDQAVPSAFQTPTEPMFCWSVCWWWREENLGELGQCLRGRKHIKQEWVLQHRERSFFAFPSPCYATA